MKNKSINQVSIINGEDGPKCFYIWRSSKQSLKIRIRNAIYQSRRKRIEKSRIDKTRHTLAEVVQYQRIIMI